MGLQTAFNSNTYRIVEYCLLKFFKTNDIHNFKYLEYSDGRPNPTLFKHFVSTDKKSNLEQAVWTDGEFAHRINKVYDSLPLVTPSLNLETSSTKVSVVLKQGFSWTDVFGIHVIIKGTQSRNVFVSKVLFIDDFKINDSRELIQGSFWVEQSDILIPRTDEILACQITTIKYSDIQADGPTIGYIYNYPEYLEPLIAEKPIPDFIQTSLDIDILSNYVKIKPFTTEAKTLEKSILDYFGQTTADISIEHVIKFGNDNDGYQSFRVSNEHNMFGEVTLGLDFRQFEKTNSYEEISDALQEKLFEEVFDEVAQLRIENTNLKAQQKIDQKSITDLTNQLTLKNTEITNLNTQLTTISQQRDNYKNQLDEKVQEINSITGQLNDKINENTNLYSQIDELSAMYVTIQQKLELSEHQRSELQDTINDLNSQISQKDITISNNNHTISTLEADVATKVIEITNLNTTISNKNREIVDLNNSLDTATNLIQSKNTKITELETDVANKKSTIEDLNLTIIDKNKYIEELEEQIKNLENQLADKNQY